MINRRRISYLLLIFVGYALAMFFTSFLDRQIRPDGLRLSALEGEPFPGLRESGYDGPDSSDFSNMLLIDSILTIIQNYYVDAERIDSRELLDRSLYALTENRLAELKIVSDDIFQISQNGESLRLKIEENYDFRDLVNDAIAIARFLDKTKEPVDSSALPKGEPKKDHDGAFVYLNSLLHALDPHSGLLDPEEYRDLRQGTEGAFGGLGVVVGMQDDLLTVIKPIPNSPASRAGIGVEDKIMSIDDMVTFGSSLDQLVHFMRGAPGTPVKLSLLRDGEDAPREISLVREVIQVSSIETNIIDQSYGPLIRIVVESFASRTADEIKEAIEQAQVKQALAGVILDLRSNPGGLLDQAVQVSDLFLEYGGIVSTEGRREEVEKAFYDKSDINLPVVVLVNNDTASASEIVAGALQDNNRAVIIGQPSFGKGSVQTVFELPGSQALKLTIARYFTPSGRSIQSVGIIPDIWLQPVYRNDKNYNLMGRERYRNERFLAHSLEARADVVQDELNPYRRAKYQGYYLVGDEVVDREIEFTKDFFRNLYQEHRGKLREENLRASYWLASGHKQIVQSLEKDNSNVDQWLQKKHRIDWQDDQLQDIALQDENALVFQLESPAELQVIDGSHVKIPWVISSKSDETLERLSIFAVSQNPYFSTVEIAIGKLAPQQSLRGTLKVPVELHGKFEDLDLLVGIAQSSWPAMSQMQKLKLNITQPREPKLSYRVKLENEFGGTAAGVLEQGETANVVIEIENHSNFDAEDISTQFVNLTGKQVQFPKKSLIKQKLARNLAGGEVHRIKLPIKVTGRVKSRSLHFGLSIDSKNLLKPLKGSFAFEGKVY